MTPLRVILTCKAPGCENEVTRNAGSRGRPPEYCGSPDCEQHRPADRKATERARAYNAFTRIELELVGPSKRRTSEKVDDEDFRWDARGGGTCWDAVASAWRPSGEGRGFVFHAASHGPEILARCAFDMREEKDLTDEEREQFKRESKELGWQGGWHETDRLMQEIERRVRSVIHRSASTPCGSLRAPRRAPGWKPGRGRSIIQIDGPSTSGDLWIQGREDEALEKAEAARTRELARCDALPTGYGNSGTFWRFEAKPPETRTGTVRSPYTVKRMHPAALKAQEAHEAELASLPDDEPWQPEQAPKDAEGRARYPVLRSAPAPLPEGPFRKVDLRDDGGFTTDQQQCEALLEDNRGFHMAATRTPSQGKDDSAVIRAIERAVCRAIDHAATMPYIELEMAA